MERAFRPASLALPALVAFALAVPLMTSDRYLLKVLSFVGLNVIVVTGLALLFGYAGQVSLGHGAFVGIGAYVCGYLTARADWPWLGALVVAVFVSSVAGLLLAVPSLRLRGHYLAMATLGFAVIAAIMFVELKDYTGGNDGLSQIPSPEVGGMSVVSPAANYLLVWGAVALVLILASGIARGRSGRAMVALHGSENGAQACGVDPVRVKLVAFTVSAGLAGFSGALYSGVVGFVSPSSFGLQASIILLAMVVLGGSRSLLGPALAAILLTLLQYTHTLIPGLSREAAAILQDWEPDIYGIVIVFVMLFAPGGMAGLGRSALTRLGVRRAGEAGPS